MPNFMDITLLVHFVRSCSVWTAFILLVCCV